MNYIITKRQYKLLTEQNEFSYQTGPGTFYGTYGYDKKGETTWTKLDSHTKNQVIALVGGFIPTIGPVISLVYGMKDAKEYWDEGDKKTAGFIGLFSILPILGPASKFLGISGWSSKALGEIGKKISSGSKLLPQEVEVVKKVAQNRKLIEDGMKKIGQEASIRAGKELAKSEIKKSAIKTGIKNIGKEGLGNAAVGVGYDKGYDLVRKNTIRVKTSKEGYDWDFVKTSFRSSGDDIDNKLLDSAWDKGWRPGNSVPMEFQTQLYKKSPDDLKSLEDLLARVK